MYVDSQQPYSDSLIRAQSTQTCAGACQNMPVHKLLLHPLGCQTALQCSAEQMPTALQAVLQMHSLLHPYQ